jgi:hypothetical protein
MPSAVKRTKSFHEKLQRRNINISIEAIMFGTCIWNAINLIALLHCEQLGLLQCWQSLEAGYSKKLNIAANIPM